MRGGESKQAGCEASWRVRRGGYLGTAGVSAALKVAATRTLIPIETGAVTESTVMCKSSVPTLVPDAAAVTVKGTTAVSITLGAVGATAEDTVVIFTCEPSAAGGLAAIKMAQVRVPAGPRQQDHGCRRREAHVLQRGRQDPRGRVP